MLHLLDWSELAVAELPAPVAPAPAGAEVAVQEADSADAPTTSERLQHEGCVLWGDGAGVEEGC